MGLTVVRNNRLYPIADSWVPWGAKRLMSIFFRVGWGWVEAVEAVDGGR
jgi:hypothetical protein